MPVNLTKQQKQQAFILQQHFILAVAAQLRIPSGVPTFPRSVSKCIYAEGLFPLLDIWIIGLSREFAGPFPQATWRGPLGTGARNNNFWFVTRFAPFALVRDAQFAWQSVDPIFDAGL
ncbi:hypothetical protein JTE90_021627 [Oedothorax gibbosus]|uniref:Uncharacterized protein n=1 Tax=Oedothorax gibbosus TaxID=931172 RepID=A0AAV6VNX9_9ARAC|nr:hypothetical protein JTE90_021627 [Oedothorax gibbosus]